jgi:tetratricopeptide (TPR) repeat protein
MIRCQVLITILASVLFGSLTAVPGVIAGEDYIRGETPASGVSDGDPIDLLSFKTHSRLRIRIDEGVGTSWKEVPGGFELLLKGLLLSDLGAPLGGETDWSARFSKLADTRLSGLALSETSAGVLIKGRWKFPKGEQAPAKPTMEHFDYRENSPARLVLDFWTKDGPSVAQQKKLDLERTREEERKQAEANAKARDARREQREAARREEENLVRFCQAPLNEKSDVFLEFLPVQDSFELSKHIIQNRPEDDYDWVRPEEGEKDGAHLKLALRLHREKKHALALRTIDFFEKDFPSSRYRREMQFLKSSAQLALGMVQDAQQGFEEIRRNSPDSRAALRSALYSALETQKSGAPLIALEHWIWLIRYHPEHPKAWVFHLMAARNLDELRQTERAAKEYQWVAQNAPDRKERVEGAVRVGDLFYRRRQYERSLASYFQAMNLFPEETKVFPAIHLNRAESFYWLGQVDRAAEAYTEFLARFPAHSAGWRATYRLGEALARKEDAESQSRARDRFMETINRYPTSPGAQLARLRLLPCGDHAGFDTATAREFFSREIATFDGAGEVQMERWKDHLALSQVRSLISLGDHGTAIDVAIKSVEGGVPTEPRRLILGMLRSLFRRTVLDHLAAGRKYEALKFHQDKIRDFPMIRGYREDAVNPDYLLRLSEAATELGMGKLASTLVDQYHRMDAQSQSGARAIASASEEGKTGVSLGLDEVLEKAEKAWLEARALWMTEQGRERGTLDAFLAMIPEQSPRSYGAHIMKAILREKSGTTQEALAELIQARLLLPPSEGVIPGEALRLEAWIARLQEKGGDQLAAIATWRNITLQLEEPEVRRLPAVAPQGAGVAASLGAGPIPALEDALRSEALILTRLEKWAEADEAWRKLISVVEKPAAESGESAVAGPYRYERARVLARIGGRDKLDLARTELQEIVKRSKDETWKKLAQESLSLGMETAFLNRNPEGSRKLPGRAE